MMMMWLIVAILLSLFCSTAVVGAEQPVVLKPVVVFVEGDSSVIPKFINVKWDRSEEWTFILLTS